MVNTLNGNLSDQIGNSILSEYSTSGLNENNAVNVGLRCNTTISWTEQVDFVCER